MTDHTSTLCSHIVQLQHTVLYACTLLPKTQDAAKGGLKMQVRYGAKVEGQLRLKVAALLAAADATADATAHFSSRRRVTEVSTKQIHRLCCSIAQ
jgi:hypothetical protein